MKNETTSDVVHLSVFSASSSLASPITSGHCERKVRADRQRHTLLVRKIRSSVVHHCFDFCVSVSATFGVPIEDRLVD